MSALIKLTVLMVAFIVMANATPVYDMPPHMPWVPTWVECDFSYGPYKTGPVCNDCNSFIRCTPVGGIVRNCFGATPYCVNGKCSETPSADCADAETVTDINL